MARIGIYCGSFNPVHLGHIAIAKRCISQGLVDKVMIIATGAYWNKKDLICLSDRINMLKLIKDENIIIDEKYNNLPYTYMIFDELGKDYPNDSFSLVLGADNLLKFEDWKEYKKLLNYDFIVVNREDIDTVKQMERLNKNNYQILDIPRMDISSTYIRNNINDYELIKDMIDKDVYDYLKGKKHYAT